MPKQKYSRPYKCKNPDNLLDCFGTTVAVIGSEREIEKLCPVCEDFKNGITKK